MCGLEIRILQRAKVKSDYWLPIFIYLSPASKSLHAPSMFFMKGIGVVIQ